jgi:hypothetical protein
MEYLAIQEQAHKKELAAAFTSKTLVRLFKGLEIHLFHGTDHPVLMDEVGRIREIEFRAEGGGTGKALDIDDFDLARPGYYQIVAWDPKEQDMVAMYRFTLGSWAHGRNSLEELATYKLFSYTEEFKQKVLPVILELGRSVVNRQAKKRIVGLFAIWSGLGAIMKEYPELEYCFGKVTTYPPMGHESRDLLLTFLDEYFPGKTNSRRVSLVAPRETVEYHYSKHIACPKKPLPFNDAIGQITDYLKDKGLIFPPLLHSYLGLTPELESYGTAVNPAFGKVYESAILVPIKKIDPKRKSQFIDNYESINPGAFPR